MKASLLLATLFLAACGSPAEPAEPAAPASAPDAVDPWTAEFMPPMELDGPRIHLEPLGPQHAELDYAAYMSSREHLQATLHWGSWPAADDTVEQDRADLTRHMDEFVSGKGYAYTVLTPDRSRCVGCIYLDPGLEEFPSTGPTAALAYWVVADELDSDLDRELLQSVLQWIETDWPFVSVAVPLRVENERGCAIARDLGLEELPEVRNEHRQFVWHR